MGAVNFRSWMISSPLAGSGCSSRFNTIVHVLLHHPHCIMASPGPGKSCKIYPASSHCAWLDVTAPRQMQQCCSPNVQSRCWATSWSWKHLVAFNLEGLAMNQSSASKIQWNIDFAHHISSHSKTLGPSVWDWNAILLEWNEVDVVDTTIIRFDIMGMYAK